MRAQFPKALLVSRKLAGAGERHQLELTQAGRDELTAAVAASAASDRRKHSDVRQYRLSGGVPVAVPYNMLSQRMTAAAVDVAELAVAADLPGRDVLEYVENEDWPPSPKALRRLSEALSCTEADIAPMQQPRPGRLGIEAERVPVSPGLPQPNGLATGRVQSEMRDHREQQLAQLDRDVSRLRHDVEVERLTGEVGAVAQELKTGLRRYLPTRRSTKALASEQQTVERARAWLREQNAKMGAETLEDALEALDRENLELEQRQAER